MAQISNTTRIPNLFVAGAPKCGTTTLHAWLSQHPEIFMCTPKEPRYWCFDLHAEADAFHRDSPPGRNAVARCARRTYRWAVQRWSASYDTFRIRSWEDYRRLFQGAGRVRYAGEASADYAWSAVAAPEIHRFNPDSRILFAVRDPVDFVLSMYRELRSGRRGEPVRSLADALALEDARSRKEMLPYTARFPSTLFYRRNARFSEQLRRFTEVFPKDQILVLLIDDMRDDVRRTYEGVMDFLGLSADSGPVDLAPRNVTPAMRLSVRDRMALSDLRFELVPEVERLGAMIGRDLVSLWQYPAMRG